MQTRVEDLIEDLIEDYMKWYGVDFTEAKKIMIEDLEGAREDEGA